MSQESPLHSLLRKEWESFRFRLDELLQRQGRLQEELLANALQETLGLPFPSGENEQQSWRLSPSSAGKMAAPAAGTPAAVGTPRAMAKLRNLAGNISQIDVGHPSSTHGVKPVFSLDPEDHQNWNSSPSSANEIAVPAAGTPADFGIPRGTAKLRGLASNISQLDGRHPGIKPFVSLDSETCGNAYYAVVPATVPAGEEQSELKDLMMDVRAALMQMERLGVGRPSPANRAVQFRQNACIEDLSESHVNSMSTLEDICVAPRTGLMHTILSSAVEQPRSTNISFFMENTRGQVRGPGRLRRWFETKFGGFASCVNWWENLKVPEPEGRLASFVRCRHFEALVLSVILCNTLFTWYSTNYDVSHYDSPRPAHLFVFDWCFVAFYTVELTLKLCVHRLWFFVNLDMRWNILDTSLVFSSLADQILSTTIQGNMGVDLTYFRSVRLLKMASLLRGLRAVKFFEELRMMVESLLGSVASLMWGIVMMVLIFYSFGLIFVQGAASEFGFAHISDEERILVIREFGSVESAMVALYRASTGGDDWSYFLRITACLGPLYAALFCFYIAFSQIALLNILTAAFVNKAMDVAKPDKDTIAMEQRKRDLDAYEDLRALGEELDPGNTGTITAADFERGLGNGRLGARLAVLGLNIPDADFFFDLLVYATDGDSKEVISITDFVEGCMRMRGVASGIDLHLVDKQTRLILRRLRQHEKDVAQRMGALTDAIKTLLPGLGDLRIGS